jgi:hypothetical protein
MNMNSFLLIKDVSELTFYSSDDKLLFGVTYRWYPNSRKYNKWRIFSSCHEELGPMLQVEMQAMKTLAEANRRQVQTQLKEAETRVERGACQRTRTGAGTAKPSKFDRSTS